MATGTVRDRIFANLIAALQGIDGGADVSTSVNQESAAAGYTLYVLSTSGLIAGRPIIIDRGGDREEVLIIDTIGSGLVTTRSALAYMHTLLQADSVEMGWYNQEITYIKSSAALRRAMDAPWPAISARALDESAPEGDEFEGEFDEQIFRAEIMVLGCPSTDEPIDQELDELREEYSADVHKAVMADGTRGGLAHWTRIVSTEPIEATAADNDSSSELPLIGIRTMIEIAYDHLRGNRYA